MVLMLDQALKCDYRVMTRAPSPDGKYVATTMDPGCGGATGHRAMYVLLSPAAAKPDHDKDRVATLYDGYGSAEWTDRGLLVKLGEGRLTEHEPSRWGQPVVYDPAP
jgi:hypothetical protein